MIDRAGFDATASRPTDGVLFRLPADADTAAVSPLEPGVSHEAAGVADTGDAPLPRPEPDARALRAGLEAVLLVADEPVDAPAFARALGCATVAVTEALGDLVTEYDEQQRGFELREVAGGWRLYSRAAQADLVERFLLDGQQARLSQAALETLAVVAYRQPVSRSRIAAIRGVNVDGVIRTLVNRGLVAEAGTDPEGTATLYRTTDYFLERLGVAGLHELPEVAEFLPEIGTVEDADF